MTLKEIESATKRNILDRIKEAVETNDYQITKDGLDDAIIVDGIKITLWETAYYVRMTSCFSVSVHKAYGDVTDEDREVHNKLRGLADADGIKQTIEKKEQELAELKEKLAAATATA